MWKVLLYCVLVVWCVLVDAETLANVNDIIQPSININALRYSRDHELHHICDTHPDHKWCRPDYVYKPSKKITKKKYQNMKEICDDYPDHKVCKVKPRPKDPEHLTLCDKNPNHKWCRPDYVYKPSKKQKSCSSCWKSRSKLRSKPVSDTIKIPVLNKSLRYGIEHKLWAWCATNPGHFMCQNDYMYKPSKKKPREPRESNLRDKKKSMLKVKDGSLVQLRDYLVPQASVKDNVDREKQKQQYTRNLPELPLEDCERCRFHDLVIELKNDIVQDVTCRCPKKDNPRVNVSREDRYKLKFGGSQLVPLGDCPECRLQDLYASIDDAVPLIMCWCTEKGQKIIPQRIKIV